MIFTKRDWMKLDGNPVIAINPDPDRWDGKLLPFEVGNLKDVALKTMADIADSKTITFVEARTNDGQVMLGVNDLFIGPKSHTSARYNIHWNGQSECHSSSGIIISTGFGSTEACSLQLESLSQVTPPAPI